MASMAGNQDERPGRSKVDIKRPNIYNTNIQVQIDYNAKLRVIGYDKDKFWCRVTDENNTWAACMLKTQVKVFDVQIGKVNMNIDGRRLTTLTTSQATGGTATDLLHRQIRAVFKAWSQAAQELLLVVADKETVSALQENSEALADEMYRAVPADVRRICNDASTEFNADEIKTRITEERSHLRADTDEKLLCVIYYRQYWTMHDIATGYVGKADNLHTRATTNRSVIRNCPEVFAQTRHAVNSDSCEIKLLTQFNRYNPALLRLAEQFWTCYLNTYHETMTDQTAWTRGVIPQQRYMDWVRAILMTRLTDEALRSIGSHAKPDPGLNKTSPLFEVSASRAPWVLQERKDRFVFHFPRPRKVLGYGDTEDGQKLQVHLLNVGERPCITIDTSLQENGLVRGVMTYVTIEVMKEGAGSHPVPYARTSKLGPLKNFDIATRVAIMFRWPSANDANKWHMQAVQSIRPGKSSTITYAPGKDIVVPNCWAIAYQVFCGLMKPSHGDMMYPSLNWHSEFNPQLYRFNLDWNTQTVLIERQRKALFELDDWMSEASTADNMRTLVAMFPHFASGRPKTVQAANLRNRRRTKCTLCQRFTGLRSKTCKPVDGQCENCAWMHIECLWHDEDSVPDTLLPWIPWVAIPAAVKKLYTTANPEHPDERESHFFEVEPDFEGLDLVDSAELEAEDKGRLSNMPNPTVYAIRADQFLKINQVRQYVNAGYIFVNLEWIDSRDKHHTWINIDSIRSCRIQIKSFYAKFPNAPKLGWIQEMLA